MKTFDIQKEILRKLLGAMSLRYRDMRPSDVENDLYNYHLQFLVQKGFVKKSDEGYALSDKGVKLIADEKPLDPLGNYADLFKVNVITVVFRKNKDGQTEILMQKRKRHPSMGHVLAPGGAIAKGEIWQEASKRNIKEETGLEILDPVLVGFARRIAKNGARDIVMDSLYFLAVATDVQGELLSYTDFGQNIWLPQDEAYKNQTKEDDNLVSVADVIRALPHHLAMFYKEETKLVK